MYERFRHTAYLRSSASILFMNALPVNRELCPDIEITMPRC